jgi:hypothetical protein
MRESCGRDAAAACAHFEEHGWAPPPEARWRGGSLGCGDVVLMDSRTVHRALPNVTANRVRLSADSRFAPGARARA